MTRYTVAVTGKNGFQNHITTATKKEAVIIAKSARNAGALSVAITKYQAVR